MLDGSENATSQASRGSRFRHDAARNLPGWPAFMPPSRRGPSLMQHAPPKPTASNPADRAAIEAQEDALERLLNDADSPFDPARVWQLLDDLARATKSAPSKR